MNSMIFAVLLASAALVLGHGRVRQPPSRASAWRDHKWDVPTNYDDNGLNCGGHGNQWNRHNGKCGICGDPYQDKTPRSHEYKGDMYRGVIVANYQPGAIINITVEITAFHQGYWVFRLCTDHTSSDQACFDKHPLEVVGRPGITKFIPKRGNGFYNVLYKLPARLTCKHCVLQWRYITGHNADNSRPEEFRACSDVSIMAKKPGNDLDGGKWGVHLDVDNHLKK